MPESPSSTSSGITSPQKPRMTLDTLPFEIRHRIAQQCRQADAFRLCLTCKSLYESTISRLYQCIVLDSSHKHFNKEVKYKRLRPRSDLSESYFSSSSSSSSWPDPVSGGSPASVSTFDSEVSITSSALDEASQEQNERYFAYTSVHTVGGMRQCIRALTKDPSKAAYIRRFEVLHNMDLPDFEIRQFLARTLPAMTNLAIFVWSATPLLTVDLLALLKQAPVETLCLAMKLTRETVAGLGELRFPQLHKLELEPFVTSEFLPHVARMLANSSETVQNLRHLHLDRSCGAAGTGAAVAAGSGDPFLAFASLDPQGVITPAGAGGPVGNAGGVVGRGNDGGVDRTTRGRAFWGLDGRMDDRCISAFFGTLRQEIAAKQQEWARGSYSAPDYTFSIPIPRGMSYGLPGKLHLEYLGLRGVMVRGHEDFALLEQCVELSALERLHLSGVDTYNADIDGLPEHNTAEGCDSRGRPLAAGFLPNLARQVARGLRSVTIDWSENGRDTVPAFLAGLPSGPGVERPLQSLKVVIRWSAAKAGRISWPRLCEMYSKAIVSRHGKTLRNLVMDLGFDNTFGTETAGGQAVPFAGPGAGGTQTLVLGLGGAGTFVVTAPAGNGPARGGALGTVAALSSGCIRQLAGCQELRGLSIAAPSMGVVEEVVRGLPKLEFLRLRNSQSKPYLGQNTAYLLEDWLRYKHIVETFWREQGEPGGARGKALRFVKLENYVFELQQSAEAGCGDPSLVQPRVGSPGLGGGHGGPSVSVILREGLGGWFAAQCEGLAEE